MPASTKARKERDRDIVRKRQSVAAGKDVVIQPCKDRRLRRRLEKDDAKWLRYFFPVLFWYEFTQQQIEMQAAIAHVITYGGDQALAASRGEGKTKLFERMLLKYTLQGVVDFSVLFGATSEAAGNSLKSIKDELAENDRLNDLYPEVCNPIRALENTPNRAHYQTASGTRFDNRRKFSNVPIGYSWCGQEIIFPRVPGSPSSGAIFATRGLDSAVRGLNKGNRRPSVAGIDDPDTEDTARSEDQAAKLEDRIDKAIGGLGGQQRGIARVMLTTLQSRISASYKFTDPQQKPSWNGKRFRFLITQPDRMDLWDEYVQLRITDQQNGDRHGRRAHDFYLKRRKSMDAGAEIANPNRYDQQVLPDGSQKEVSALQRYYNEVARIGPEAVATEYDNDPPDEMGVVESGITATRIQLRLSGYPRGIVPPGTVALTQGIDLQKAGAHWVVRAWMADATNYVIDYGFHESHGTTYASDEGVELAIYRVMCERMEYITENPYMFPDGEVVDIGMTLADSGWKTDSVYRACLTIGLGIYPAKGHGKSHGCATPNFRVMNKRSWDTRPGDGWFQSKQKIDGRIVWLVNCDTDRWKSFEHERWMTGEGKPGAAYIFGSMNEDERRHLHRRLPQAAKDHHAYARHLTAEIEVEEPIRGVIVRRWKAKPGRVNNHYLDASYLSNVAASMLGVRLIGSASPAGEHQQQPRRPLGHAAPSPQPAIQAQPQSKPKAADTPPATGQRMTLSQMARNR